MTEGTFVYLGLTWRWRLAKSSDSVNLVVVEQLHGEEWVTTFILPTMAIRAILG